MLGADTFAGYLHDDDDAAPLLDQQVVMSRPAPTGGVSDKGVDLRPCVERAAR